MSFGVLTFHENANVYVLVETMAGDNDYTGKEKNGMEKSDFSMPMPSEQKVSTSSIKYITWKKPVWIYKTCYYILHYIYNIPSFLSRVFDDPVTRMKSFVMLNLCLIIAHWCTNVRVVWTLMF